MQFISPTKGEMSFQRMFDDITAYMEAQPEASYKLIIGSDSHVAGEICFVTAVIVHRIGKGARYFYRRHRQGKVNSLRQKIFYETSLSLVLANDIANAIELRELDDQLNIEIHLDVGPNGDTRHLIREIVGMVNGSGFDAKIKPESFGASKVADKYTKQFLTT